MLLDNRAHAGRRVARVLGVAPELDQFVTVLTKRAKLILDGGQLPVEQLEDSRAGPRTVTAQAENTADFVQGQPDILRFENEPQAVAFGRAIDPVAGRRSS